MAATLWKGVLSIKAYLFRHNVLWCNTLLVPVHRALQQYYLYRYYSALLLGPDDQLWKDLGIPFVKSTWRDGALDLTQPQHVSDMSRKKMHGVIFGTYEGRTPVIVISDVSMIKEVLENFECFRHRRVYLCGHEIFDNMLPMIEGGKWRRIKSIIQKPFSYSTGINTPTDLMLTCANIVVEQILKVADSFGIVLDSKTVFGVYSMDVITRVIYGRPIKDFENPDNLFIQNSIKLLLEDRDDILLNTVRYPEFERRPQDCPFHPEAIEYFRQYVEHAVSERVKENKSGSKFDDLLQDLVDCYRNNTLSLEELYAQVIVLTALSYHSIAFTVTLACFEISQNNAIQKKLQAEIDNCVLKSGGINDDALENMNYLENVLNETLRKYPPGVRIERVCNAPATVGRIRVKEGTVIVIPVYALHHDPELYPDPESFDPDRFEATYPFCGFLPFGEGKRKCIARTFAMREMKLLIACLLGRVELLPPLHTSPLVLTCKKNILLAGNIPLRVQRRLFK